jgi:hypothetical protein
MGANNGNRVHCLLPQNWSGRSGRSGSPREWLISGRAAGRALPDVPGWISRHRLPATRRTTYTATARAAGEHHRVGS